MVKKSTKKFWRYYRQWIDLNKVGEIKAVTLAKYYQTARWLEANEPDIVLGDMTRSDLQRIVNDYGKTHERTTVMDMLNRLKASIRDAVYDGYLKKDPIHKIRITSQVEHKERLHYLEAEEVLKLVGHDPIFGDKRGHTRWFVFIKPNRESSLPSIAPDLVKRGGKA